MPRPRRATATTDTEPITEAVSPTETLKQVLNMDPDTSDAAPAPVAKRGRPRRVIQTPPPEFTDVPERPVAPPQVIAPAPQVYADASSDAYDRLTALAKAAVESGVAPSFEIAMSDAALANTDLYKQDLTEKGAK